MANRHNRIIRMIMDCTRVIVDNKTLKDMYNPPQIDGDDAKNIMQNIDNYHITFFNRDIRNGERILILTTNKVM